MKAFPAIRSAARQRLGSTFRLERRDEPADVDFELVATHQTGLQSPSIDGHDTAMADFRTKHWHLRDFVATIQGPLLLDPGLGWVVRGHDLLEIGNWSLVAQPPTLVKPSLLR